MVKKNKNFTYNCKNKRYRNIINSNCKVYYDSDIFIAKEDNLYLLCRFIVNTIKKMIGIDNDNFDEYRFHIEKKGIDSKGILRYLLSKETILDLSEKVKYLGIHKYRLQIKRCLQVITSLFLICSNYKSLKNFLKKIINLEDKQIRNTLKKYVSVLGKVNPELMLVDGFQGKKYSNIHMKLLKI